MKLEDWRNEIDAIDQEIVRLVNQRAGIAKKIGALKTNAGLPIADTDREEKILRGICDKNPGDLPDESLIRIFRQIIRESKQIQTKIADQILENKTEIYR